MASKKYRLGEVIGTSNEGAVLAATAFLIGGGLLLLAVEDVHVDGERLEGVGVAPHDRSPSWTRTPWIVVILNSIVQSRSYPGSDPRGGSLLAPTLFRRTGPPPVKCCFA